VFQVQEVEATSYRSPRSACRTRFFPRFHTSASQATAANWSNLPVTWNSRSPIMGGKDVGPAHGESPWELPRNSYAFCPHRFCHHRPPGIPVAVAKAMTATHTQAVDATVAQVDETWSKRGADLVRIAVDSQKRWPRPWPRFVVRPKGPRRETFRSTCRRTIRLALQSRPACR